MLHKFTYEFLCKRIQSHQHDLKHVFRRTFPAAASFLADEPLGPAALGLVASYAGLGPDPVDLK